MTIYILALEWYEKKADEIVKPTRHYFFNSADTALNFGHKIAYSKTAWENAGCPYSVYLYKVDTFSNLVDPSDISPETYEDRKYCFDMDNHFICFWPRCDKYLHT